MAARLENALEAVVPNGRSGLEVWIAGRELIVSLKPAARRAFHILAVCAKRSSCENS